MNAHPMDDRIADLALGLLPEEEARLVEVHLGACAGCASRLERFTSERETLEQALATPVPAGLAARILDRGAKRRMPFRWEVAAATLLFTAVAVFIYRSEPGGPRSISLGTSSSAVLAPGSETVVHDRELVLTKGGGRFSIGKEEAPLRISTPAGTLTARAAEFTVELRRARDTGGPSMELLLALVVSVSAGEVRADVLGKTYAVVAGQTGVFSGESASLSPVQDDDDKEKKEKKGKKKEGEKEEGKKKEKKDDKDEKDEKNEKDNNKEKGKNEKDGQNNNRDQK